MFEYAKAHLLMVRSVISLAAFSRAIYWLVERKLPVLITLLLPGEADSKPKQRPRGLDMTEKPVSLETVSPSIPIKLSMAIESPVVLEEVRADSVAGACIKLTVKKPVVGPRTRSWKIPFKDRNRLPDPVYKNGNVAWLTVEGENGSFKVDIVTDGKWNDANQVWEYQVRQTDGELYDKGALVGEDSLHRGKK